MISLRDCIAYLHPAPDEVDASACGDDQRGQHPTEVLKHFVAPTPSTVDSRAAGAYVYFLRSGARLQLGSAVRMSAL